MIKNISALMISTLICFNTAYAADLNQRDDVKQFIDKMVNEHQFDKKQLQGWFSKTELQPKIIEAISRPAEKKLKWHEYRKIFVKPNRIEKGVIFWTTHKETLARAEKEYGVPAHIITAIIGVETRYGEHKGRYRVIDSLVTLGFDYPKRSKFFKSELEHYLLLVRDEGVDPFSINGSYAGAMGIPQFISSSYRHYAIDFDGDGIRDLWNNPVDAIGSVANYFKQHGWQTGQGVVIPTKITGDSYQTLIKRGLKPHTPLAEFAKFGLSFDTDADTTMDVSLIELDQPSSKEHWIAFKNFYVITRYNHSPLYAMAAYQLSLEIKKAHDAS